MAAMDGPEDARVVRAAASLFRAIAEWTPTLALDEADTFVAGRDADPELRGILNAGFARPLWSEWAGKLATQERETAPVMEVPRTSAVQTAQVPAP